MAVNGSVARHLLGSNRGGVSHMLVHRNTEHQCWEYVTSLVWTFYVILVLKAVLIVDHILIDKHKTTQLW